ncbi:MAG: DUF2652 domain-containing protein [Ferruginibacter sp.]
MAETSATILIPDISGFTEFVTKTELSHSTFAINLLIDSIVNAVGDDYEISEIEGDAVLMIKKDPLPTKKEIYDICIKIFNAFHFQRKWMEQYTICPCGACQALDKLTLKFIVHHGPLAEIKVGRFLKHSGSDMIVAHRLLKNSINNNEYLLFSEKLLNKVTDDNEVVEQEWVCAFEQYDSIGKVDYRFKLLNDARKHVPEPPSPADFYLDDNIEFVELPIAANYMFVYMTLMNVPDRASWLHGLEKVEQDTPNAFIGSLHLCIFENYQAVVSPLRMRLSNDSVTYLESCRINELKLFLANEFIIKKATENTCTFAYRYMNAGETPMSEETKKLLSERLTIMAERLKEHCEKNSE